MSAVAVAHLAAPTPEQRRDYALEASRNGHTIVPAAITWKPDGDKVVNFHDKTWVKLTTPSEVAQWWDLYPDDFPAVLTGDVVLVDLDDEAAAAWWAANGAPGYPLPSISGRRHQYFRGDPERPVKGTASDLFPHLDTRGRGGIAFLGGRLPRLAELPPAPDILPKREARPSSGGAAFQLPESDGTFEQFTTRRYTMEQAAAALSVPFAALKAAPRRKINGMLHHAALQAGHFIRDFWPEPTLRGWLIEAQRAAWVASGGPDDGDYRAAHGTINSAFGFVAAEQYLRVEDGPPPVASERPVEPPVERPDGTIVTRSPSGRTLVLTPASAIRPKRVHWIWDGRWALGTLALLAGREGLGKSTLAYWAAARITRGELPGEFRGQARAVLVCATEDSWEHTIVPRLMAAGADLGLVYRVEVVDADEVHVGLSLPRDLHKVEETALATNAGLLLLDPLMSRLDASLDTHRDGETRRALEPLAALADRAGLVVLGLIHLNKSGGNDPLNSVMGSKAFTAVARSVSFVVADPDDEEERRRLFGTPKNNLGRTDLPTLAFVTVSHPIETDEGPTSVGRVEWGAESSLSIGEAMSSSAEDPEVRSAQAEASEWLSEYLGRTGGSADSKVTKDAARAAGHSERTLQRARRALKLRVVTMGSPPRSTWSLPLRAIALPELDASSVPSNAESSVPRVWGGGTVGTVGIIAGQSVSGSESGTVICANCANCAKPPRACTCAPARDSGKPEWAQ